MSRLLPVLCALLLVFGVHAEAGEASKRTPKAALQEAWRLYNFTEFKNADRIFAEVQEDPKASADEKLQARIGRTFVVQYRQPGGDPVAAALQYEAILKELPETHAFRALVLSRLADCSISKDKPDAVAARKYLAKAMALAEKKSLLYQECVIQLALTHIRGKPSRDDLQKCLATLDKHMASLEGGRLKGAAHYLAAGVAQVLGDHKRMEKELEAWDKAGIQNFTFRAPTYFRIARLNEIKLGNPDKARQYYEKLADKEPSDKRAYFARKRAAEIKAGKIKDGDLALPKEAFQGKDK